MHTPDKKIIRSSGMETKRTSKAPTIPYPVGPHTFNGNCLACLMWDKLLMRSKGWQSSQEDKGTKLFQAQSEGTLLTAFEGHRWQLTRQRNAYFAAVWHSNGHNVDVGLAHRRGLSTGCLCNRMSFWDGFSYCNAMRPRFSSQLHHLLAQWH